MVYDVIIAGAGPVGLFLACELRLAKLSVLVLEQSEDPHSPLKRLPFGMRGLWGPSVEAFYRRGLLEQIASQSRADRCARPVEPDRRPGQQRRGPAGHFAGIQFDHSNIDSSRWTYRLPGPADIQLGSAMEHLERVLAAHALSVGVEIQRGHGVDGFEASDDEVTVHAGEQRIRARWLVGCDGGRSTVRKQGGFEFVGTEPEFTGYSVHVDIADPAKLRMGRQAHADWHVHAGAARGSRDCRLRRRRFPSRRADHVRARASGAAAGVQHGRDPHGVARRLDMDRPLEASDDLPQGTGAAGGRRRAHSFTARRARLEPRTRRRDEPRVEACRDHPRRCPRWLARQLHHGAASGRGAHPRLVAGPGGADAQSSALAAIVRDLIDTRDGATYFAERVWGVSLRYDLGDEHPLVGRSCPDFELEDGARLGVLLRDGKGVLLDFHPGHRFDRSPAAWTSG